MAENKETLKYEPGVGIRFTELKQSEKPAELKEKVKLPEELLAEKIQTVEQKTTELTTDGQQEVVKVESGVNLPSEEIAVTREEIKLDEKLQKITNEATTLGVETKEKLNNIVAQSSEAVEISKKPELELAEGLDKDHRLENIKNELVENWKKNNPGKDILSAEGQNFLYGDPTDWKKGTRPTSVEQRAAKLFADHFPEEAKGYTEKEKTRIYEDPNSDPAIKDLEENITRMTNQTVQPRGDTNYTQNWNRNFDRISIQQWDGFISKYPEKAAGYKDKYSSVKEAFERQERLSQYRAQKELEKKREAERLKTIEDDQTFRSFMDNETDGLNARVWRGVSRAEGLTGNQYDEKARVVREQMMQEFLRKNPEVASKYGLGKETKEERQERQERREREINEPLIEEARRKRNQILEGRGLLTMSKADFSRYFASKDFEIRTNLKQGNTGDCYAVAAIHAMSRSPHFEMIVRSSIKKLPDGSWEVKIPLLGKETQVVKITPEELLPQKNRQFLKRSEKGGIMPDLRRKLMPVAGKEGLQVLEAAFIKQKFGTVDRLAAEGGWGDNVLMDLGGDNFKRFSFDAATYNEKEKKWEWPGLAAIPNQKYIDNFLENFDPEVYIATINTKFFDTRTVTGALADALGLPYKAEGTAKFFVPGHAYSISKVDSQKKTVLLANPWNTAKPIELTFDQLKKTFNSLSAVRVDHAKLLGNMKSISGKVAA